MSEPKRLIEESDSPLERMVLQAGNDAPGGDRLRLKVLLALGVAAAVSSTSKTSLAMAAGWKQAIVVGALSCVGVASVVAYRQFSVQPQPSVVSVRSDAPKPGLDERRAELPSAPDMDRGSAATPELGARDKAALKTGDSVQGVSPDGEERKGIAAQQVAPEQVAPEQVAPDDATLAAPLEALQPAGAARRPSVHARPSARGSKRPIRGAVDIGDLGSESARVGPSTPVRAQSAVETPALERNPAERAPVESAPSDVAPRSALEQELAVLDAARGALAAGRWGDAQRHLSDYATRFPRGKLGLEAEVLRIEALASSGDAEGASRRARAILKRSPNSVVAARLRRFVRE